MVGGQAHSRLSGELIEECLLASWRLFPLAFQRILVVCIGKGMYGSFVGKDSAAAWPAVHA